MGAYAVKPLAELRNGIAEKQRIIRYREKALGCALIILICDLAELFKARYCLGIGKHIGVYYKNVRFGRYGNRGKPL